MDIPLGWQLFIQVILIAVNAVFASAEIAIVSMNELKLEKLAEDGNRRAKRLRKLTEKPAGFLATIQIAITLSGFLGSAFAADNFSDVIVRWLVDDLGVQIKESTLNTIAVIVITIILSYVTLVFGELVPKRVAMKKTQQISLGVSGLIYVSSKFFAPLVWLLTASTNLVLRILRIDPNGDDEEVSEEEIRMLVDVGGQKGIFDKTEQKMIVNVFEFDDLTAGEIATHRTDLTILWLEESMEEWAATIHNSRHTRYPVCGESADDVVGILTDRSRETVLEQAVETPYLVPDSVKADVLFRNMKGGCHPLAVVLDEYGGMTGIVTINDLVEQLVGDLGEEDVCRNALPLIEAVDSGTWKIRGEAPLEEVAQTLGVTLPCEDFDTFNGLIFGAMATIPEDGSTIEVETAGLVIRVTEIRNHQVVMALVCLAEPQNTEKQEHNRGEHE